MDRKVIIIPTYNEKENIEKMIRALRALDGDYHILIIDDGSPDGTAAIVKGLQQEFPTQLHLVERFLMVKDQAEEIGKLAHSISRDTGAFTDSEGSANHIRLERIIELAERLVDEL